MNASNMTPRHAPELSSGDAGDARTSIRWRDDRILFADHAAERIEEFERHLRRPLIVACQGPAALHAAERLSNCPDDARKTLPDTVSVPVHFQRGETTSVEVVLPERILRADRELVTTLPKGAQRVVVSISDGPRECEFVGLSNERRIGVWAQFALADVVVLCCSGELHESQVAAVEQIAANFVGKELVLFQVQGGSALARRNHRILRERRTSPKVFTSGDGLQSYLRLLAERRQLALEAEMTVVVGREARRLVSLQRSEQELLAAPGPSALEGTRGLASRAEHDWQRGCAGVQRAIDGIEHDVMLLLDQHLQSGGPILESLEAILDRIPLVSFEGWEAVADKLNEHLIVLAGVYVAATIEQTAARVQVAVAENFQAFGPFPEIGAAANLAGMFNAIPDVHRLSFWNSVLSGGIKGLISERMSALGTKYLPRPIGGALDKGLAVCTAVLNLKKTVAEELRTQLTLRVMPAVSSIVSPAVRSLLREMNQTVYEKAPPFYQSYVAELQELADRGGFLSELPDDQETADLVVSGMADLRLSEARLQLLIRDAAQAGEASESRARELDLKLGRLGVNGNSEEPAQSRPRELADPSRQQHAELLAFLCRALQEEFELTADAARAIGECIVGDERQSPGPPVGAVDTRSVVAGIVGLDVCYERQESRVWQRRTRLFVRAAQDKSLREHRETKQLQWTDLPNEVRDASLSKNENSQRFVIFPQPLA